MTTLTGPAFAVDGVPVHYRQTPGPTRATLSFRVGTADERLPERGITRLLTYVAAAASGIDSPTTFVRTSFTMTSFSFSGSAADVAHDIGALCHSLTNLDPRILDRQRQVVLRGRQPDSPAHSPEHSALLRARYGPEGWGADGLPEFGALSLDLEALRGWSTQNFTAGNLVTCVSGPRPRKLRIPLPAGNLRPVPEPVSDQSGASVRRMPGTELSLGGVLELGPEADLARTATGLLGTLIRGRAVNAIQQQLGLRLGARTSTLAMGAHRAHLALWSDTVGTQRARATDVAIGALETLVAEGVTATEAEFYCSRRRGALEATARSARGIHALAEQEVVGALIAVPWSAQAELARLDQITPSLLGEQAAALLEAVLLVGPPELRPPRPWSDAAVPAPPTPIDGTTHRSRPAYLRRAGSTGGQRRAGAEADTAGAAVRRLTLGAEGAYLRSADGADLSLHWPDVRLTAAYDDGRRLLMDRHGSTLDARPEEWLHPEAVTQQIDTLAPVASVAHLGWRRTPTGPRLRVIDRVPWWVWIPLGLVAAVLVVAGGVAPASAAPPWLRVTVGTIGVLLLAVTVRCAAAVWASGRLLRRPRR